MTIQFNHLPVDAPLRITSNFGPRNTGISGASTNHKGVDLGIWKSIPASILSCPLDVHSGNVARKLNILTRKQNDAKALKELDTKLREMDANDPVKYDFALFGLGVFEGF